MARTRRRQYGSGCLLKRGRGWAIRWRELEIAPDGTRRKALRYETLGEVTRKLASETLTQRIAAAGQRTTAPRSRVTFGTLVAEWLAHVVPMYKPSTQKNHRHIVTKHLLPRFGDRPIADVTRQEVQAYVTHLMQVGYAPKSVDHMHDVLSAVLRTAVRWGHLPGNPARDVDLPTLRCVRPKWVLTRVQAGQLLEALPPLAQTMAGLALLTGLRRGEVFALRWSDVDLEARALTVRQAVYEGVFDTPKTEAGVRTVPLSAAAVGLVHAWRARVRRTEPDALLFATWSGKPIAPNNVLRRWIVPACTRLGLQRATWLTFRRTWASWAHERGVPAKVMAQVLGHARVDTTLNVYTQVVEGAVRTAVETVGAELITIVHSPEGEATVSC